jgi:FkbM family methyltransferase
MAAEQDVDKIVLETFFLNVPRGTIVDVGAARPDYLSISESFREKGWRVLSVEPNPEFCKLYHERGYEVLQFAVGDEDKDDVDFSLVDSQAAIYQGGELSYESFSSLGIRGRFADLQKQLEGKTVTRTVKVNVRKLDTLLRDYAPDLKTIDVLAVDVEGWELTVLRGFDIDRYRPKVVILENLFNDGQYREAMDKLGYALFKVLHPNDVYVRRTAFGRIRDVLSTLVRRRTRV